MPKKEKKSSSSSTSSRLSTREITNIMEELKHQQHRQSMRNNYYAVWKLFNNFFIQLDYRPAVWSDRLSLFVAYLVHNNKQVSTVRSYISAIKAVLKSNNIKLNEDQYLLSAMTRACKLKDNKQVRPRLPIRKNLLRIILRKSQDHYLFIGQPFLTKLSKWGFLVRH